MKTAVNVDSSDYGQASQSARDTDKPGRCSSFWIGALGAGTHTIKGRWATLYNTNQIHRHSLQVYIFDGDEFIYIDNAVQVTTATSDWVNDPYATIAFTPPSECVAVFLYQLNNDNTTQHEEGKKLCITIDNGEGKYLGYQFGLANQGTDYGSVYGTTAFSFFADPTLPARSTTVQGQFACANTDNTPANSIVTVDRRQMGVLLLDPAKCQMDLISTVGTIITNANRDRDVNNQYADDPYATITRTTGGTQTLWILASANKWDLTAGSTADYWVGGGTYGIKLDGTLGWEAPIHGRRYGSDPMCSFFSWGSFVAPGTHTIQGVHSSNWYSGINYYSQFDNRHLLALWMERSYSANTGGLEAYVPKATLTALSGGKTNRVPNPISLWDGEWVTGTAYVATHHVSLGEYHYVCISNHTSGTTTQPGVGSTWTTYWIRESIQATILTHPQLTTKYNSINISAPKPTITFSDKSGRFNKSAPKPAFAWDVNWSSQLFQSAGVGRQVLIAPPVLEASGSTNVDGTGTLSFYLKISGTILKEYGTGHLKLPALVISGEGVVTITGTGTLHICFKVSGTGTVEIQGTGILKLPALQVMDNGCYGTGIIRAPPLQVSGSGTVNILGTGTLTFKTLLSGEGTTELLGTGSIGLVGKVTGTGTTTLVGSGVLKLPALQITGSAYSDVSGTGIFGLVGKVTGSGITTIMGTGILSSYFKTGGQSDSLIGTGSAGLVGKVVGSGLVGIQGTGIIKLPPLQISALSVYVPIDGTGTLGLVGKVTGSGITTIMGAGLLSAYFGVSGASDSLIGTGALRLYGKIIGTGEVGIQGTGTLKLPPLQISALSVYVPIDGTGSVGLVGKITGSGITTIMGTGSLGLVGKVTGIGLVPTDGTGTLKLYHKIIGSGITTLFGTGTLGLVGKVTGEGLVPYTGAGTLSLYHKVTGTGLTTLFGTGILKLPALNVSGYFGSGTGLLKLPALQITGSGIAGVIGTGTLSFYSAVTGSGVTSLLGTGTIKLPALQISGNVITGLHGTGTLKLPVLTVTGNGIKGILGTGSLSLIINLSGTGYHGAIGTGILKLPPLVISGTAFISTDEDIGKAIVITVKNLARTEYTNFQFNSLADFNGVYLGAKADGIYELTGDTDNTTNIDSVIKTGISDYGVSTLKNVPDVYFGISTEEDMIIRAVLDGLAFSSQQVLSKNGDGIKTRRLKMPLGIKSRYWGIEVSNTQGEDFELDIIEMRVAPIKRRL
jgi:hypothetical protein